MILNKKFPKSSLFLFAAVALTFFGCEYEESPTDCYKISVVGKDQCRGGMLVSVDSRKLIGETITYSDGKVYTNVILVYSEVEIPSFTKGFVQIRDFDRTREVNCPSNYKSVAEVPSKIASSWSEEPCSSRPQ